MIASLCYELFYDSLVPIPGVSTANIRDTVSASVKGELNPKIDFSSFEHFGIVEQLYEVFLSY